MTERKPVADAVSSLAYGYVLLHLDLYLWRINVLGDWMGLIIIAGAIKVLAEERPEIELLHPLAVGLAVWDGVCEGAYLLLGTKPDIYAVNVVVSVLSLYFHFQLLTNLADIAEAHGCPQRKKLMTLRTVRTLLLTAMALPLDWYSPGWLNYTAIGANLVTAVWILLLLFSLRKSLGWTRPPRETPPEPPEMPPFNGI